MPADDPERLISEALHAQAARAPLADSTAPAPGYGLLSGSDLPLMFAEETTEVTRPAPPRAAWVLTLAALLGLAAGSVVGLLTLL